MLSCSHKSLKNIASFNQLQSPLWGADISSALHDLPWISWNVKFCYRVHNRPPFFPVLDHFNTVYALPAQLFNTHCSIILPFMSTSCKLPLYFISPHQIQLTVLHFVTLIIFVEQYKSWSCSLGTFLRFPAISCHSTQHPPQQPILKQPQPAFTP